MDGSVAPATCYAICNSAYIDAQKIGKTPELCAAGSPFTSDYSSCQACIVANSANVTASQSMYIYPQFGVFVEYCASSLPSISLPVASSLATSSSLPTFTSSNSTTPATSTVDISISSLPIITTGILSSTSSSDYGSAYSTITTMHIESISLFNGSTITYTFTEVIPLRYQPTSSTVPSIIQSKSSSHKVALMAGILASTCSLIVLGFCFLVLRRYSKSHGLETWRRRIATNKDEDAGHEKAQLHSDCLPLNNPHEMEGLSIGLIAELQATEPVAAELPGFSGHTERD